MVRDHVVTAAMVTAMSTNAVKGFHCLGWKYSKTSLNRPTMGPTLIGPFREVVGLGS